MIRHQYEHYDGSGLPDGLIGLQIPVGSRILAVIRDYISYLDGSITGKQLPINEVKEHFLLKKEKLYDPQVVDTFFSIVEDLHIADERPVIEMSWTQLRPGMEAVEVTCNDTLYLREHILTKKLIHDIMNLREKGNKLIIKIRLGQQE